MQALRGHVASAGMNSDVCLRKLSCDDLLGDHWIFTEVLATMSSFQNLKNSEF
jgi:hypothetical protein